jgi:hypothetical protein
MADGLQARILPLTPIFGRRSKLVALCVCVCVDEVIGLLIGRLVKLGMILTKLQCLSLYSCG